VSFTGGANATAASDTIKEAKAAFTKNHTKKDGTTFSQEAVAAAGGKKFDAQLTFELDNLTTDFALPPGFFEAGPNLIELTQGGTIETDSTIVLDIFPVGSVSGLENVGGRSILSVIVAIPDITTGGIPLIGNQAQLQMNGLDPILLTPLDLVNAQLLNGGGALSVFPPFIDFFTPSLDPNTEILLQFDVGPAVLPLLPPQAILALALLILASGVVFIRRSRPATL